MSNESKPSFKDIEIYKTCSGVNTRESTRLVIPPNSECFEVLVFREIHALRREIEELKLFINKDGKDSD